MNPTGKSIHGDALVTVCGLGRPRPPANRWAQLARHARRHGDREQEVIVRLSKPNPSPSFLEFVMLVNDVPVLL